jgi:hypothetical protein
LGGRASDAGVLYCWSAFSLPEMELSQVDGVDTRLRVEAYMMWPESEKAREFYVARNLALHLAIWPEVVANNPERAELFDRCGAEFRELLISALSRAGRTALLDDTYAKEAYPEPLLDKVKCKRMTTVGLLVVLMRALGLQSQSLPGGASLLKTVFLLSNYNNFAESAIYKTRKEIFKSWRLYKKSSHLIIARSILRREKIYEDDEDYTYFWLTIARDFQNFLLNSMPLHGKKQPLLTRDEIWMVPNALDLPDFGFPQWTLPSALIDVVKRYTAPISY